jgi:DNA-binding transcriptional LysR family regulator
MPVANNLRLINLNSLPVLQAILRHGSIAKAADALNLTPPALSNTLRQLRGYFDDDLIVRQGRTMRLTPKGERLLEPLEHALTSVQDVLAEHEFDAMSSHETFRIAMTDYSMGLLAAPLASIISDEAPTMTAQFLGAGRQSVEALMSGKIDMLISPRSMMSAGLADVASLEKVTIEYLSSEPMVCIGRRDDAELTDGLTLERYLGRPHVGYFLDAEQHTSLERTHLAGLGLKQNDRLMIASYAALPMVVATSECLSVVPLSLAIAAAQVHPIQIVDPPISMPAMELVMVRHVRNQARPMLNWLENVLKRCVDHVYPYDACDIAVAA